MTTTISNLPRDLVEEILTRVPSKSMRAVQLTCTKWNALSKSRSFSMMHIGKEAAATREGESMMIVMMNYNLYLMSVIIDDDDPCIELKGKRTCLKEQIKVSQVFHCEGLLLCILKDDMTKVMIWNPYCGQIRWIKPRFCYRPDGWDSFNYAIGYEDKKSCRSFKFLRFMDYVCYEIYDFDSDLWTTLDVIPHWFILFHHQGISLKGNTYWCARERNSRGLTHHIICFDFTRERFGPLLPLPSSAGDRIYDDVTLCCVREEKLAALFQKEEYHNELEIWITTKIDAEIVSWSKFLRIHIPSIMTGFIIDEEKKVAMGFDVEDHRPRNFIIIGEDGYFRELDPGEYADQKYCWPQVCSYVSSLIQIKKPVQVGKKKQSSLEKRRFDQNILRPCGI